MEDRPIEKKREQEMANNGPTYTSLGPGDFDSPAETESELGPIWFDLAEIENALKNSDFFVDHISEIISEFLTSYRDKYAEEKMMRLIRSLAERCDEYINDLECSE